MFICSTKSNSILLFIDADYKKFLEIYNGDDEKLSSTPETLLEEIEAKTKELFGMFVEFPNQATPK